MSNEASQKPYSPGDISTRFKDYIEKQKLGLKRFYKWETEDEYNSTLKDPVNRGVVMTQQLMANGCPREVAGMLSILALYDLVMLIGTNCLRLFLRCVLVFLYLTLIDPSSCSKMVTLTYEYR